VRISHDYEQYEGILAPDARDPGHEPLGVIEQIGDAGAPLGRRRGRSRAVETMLSCRFCSACLGGLSLSDADYLYPALGRAGLWGAYAQ